MKKLDENLINLIKTKAIAISEQTSYDEKNIISTLKYYKHVMLGLRISFKEFDDVWEDAKVFIKGVENLGLVVQFDTLRYRYSFSKKVINGQYKIKGLLDAIDFICRLERYKKNELFIVNYLLDVVGASCRVREVDGSAAFAVPYVINDKHYELIVEIDCNNFITKILVRNEQGKKVNITKKLKEIAITISHLKDVEKARMNNNALRYYRIRHNMTMEQLAEKAGLTTTFVYMLESNRQDTEKISFEKLINLAKALEVHPLELTRYEVVYTTH